MTPRLRLALVGGSATLLAALSILPVVTGLRWLWLSAVVILGIVGLGESARRLRVPPALVTLIQLAATTYTVPALTVGAIGTRSGLPTTTWLRVIIDRLEVAGLDIQEHAAPVPSSPGLLLIVVGGVALNAILVDAWVAGGITAWAGLPLLLLYLVPAATADGPASWPGFCLTSIGYLALLVADRRERVRQWGQPMAAPAGSPTEATWLITLVRGGARLGLSAMAVALIVAAISPLRPLALLPGAGGDGGATIRADNPIVDLKRDLVRPQNFEVMRVRADSGDVEYLRLVTLDVFDGLTFQTGDRQVPRSQQVAEDLPTAPGRAQRAQELAVTQTYDIEVSPRYESDWLPLPYAARRISIEGDWRFDRDSLDVLAVDATTRGASYRVVSEVLTPSADLLAASAGFAQDPQALGLPDTLPPDLARLAAEATDGTRTPFEQAAALQKWFRTDGGFTYSLERAPGTSSSALQAFLEERTGYCEQFAATMTLMARTLGIPARVAVGFRPGPPSPTGVTVIGTHDAHAWPELFFAEVGWVRFEPTPATRTGTPPEWTLAPERATTDPLDPSAPTPTAEPSPEASAGPEAQVVEQPGAAASSSSRVTLIIVGTAATVAAALVAPAMLALVLRRRRWHRAGDDLGEQAEAAWQDLRFAVADAGLTWNPARTPRVQARAVADDAHLDADYRARLDRLVHVTERTRYAKPSAGAGSGLTYLLRGDAALLRRAVLSSAGRRRRVIAHLWPAEVLQFGRGPDTEVPADDDESSGPQGTGGVPGSGANGSQPQAMAGLGTSAGAPGSSGHRGTWGDDGGRRQP